jgi:4'-phosphopantetheinyl transferase
MTASGIWALPSIEDRPFPLTSDEVHVWRVSFDIADARLPHHRLRLSAEERARADRYRVPEPRRQYTIMRAALRSILGRYLDIDPAAVSFASGPEGKPELATPQHRWIEFNVSHSHGLGLCAVARRRVGVDVEYVWRRAENLEEIVKRFFSPAEHASFLELPAEKRRQGFYNGWTRKEAFIKAIGRGLFAALDSFDVSLKPEDPPRIIAVRDAAENAARWSLFSLEPDVEYTGALAVEGDAIRLSCWRWEGSA